MNIDISHLVLFQGLGHQTSSVTDFSSVEVFRLRTAPSAAWQVYSKQVTFKIFKKLLTALTLFMLAGGLNTVSAETLDDTPFETLEPTVTGKTYYVSGKGDDDNDGLNKDEAFRTLQHASDLTKPGDMVLVMNGTYTKPGPEANVLDIRNAGEPDNYIIYKAFPGHKPLIKVDSNYAGILITVPYIVIDGFTVEGNLPNLSFEEADRLARGTDKAGVLENYTYNSNGIGSFARDGNQPHHLIIRNNTVFHHPGGGIFSNNSDYVRIENNTVFNNSYYCAYANSGVSFYKSTAVDDSTGVKMWIRNNVIYKNENKVPFWFSSEADPSKRVITDGNGIIIDDSRNTQGAGGDPYVGTFLIENNVVYDNGGRGINVFESDNVIARNNTLHHNGRTKNFTEIGVGLASNVVMSGNIFSVAPDRKPLLSYSTTNISFENNLFYGGSEAPQFPAGTTTNLIKNGDFNVDLKHWELVTTAPAEHTRDSSNRMCVSVEETNLSDPVVRLVQTGLTLKKGYTYTLTFDALTKNKTGAEFQVKFGTSSNESVYYTQKVSLPVKQSETTLLSFMMTEETDDAGQLEFQVAGNAEAVSSCFDNIVLTETSNIIGKDPNFVSAGVNPLAADFRLQQSSPAVNAQTVTAPTTDIMNVTRPKGEASDLGAYESH
jgi:parallel beta-helix repeat protein